MSEWSQRVQTYKIRKSYNIGTIVNYILLYIWKLLRVDIKRSYYKKK